MLNIEEILKFVNEVSKGILEGKDNKNFSVLRGGCSMLNDKIEKYHQTIDSLHYCDYAEFEGIMQSINVLRSDINQLYSMVEDLYKDFKNVTM